jgi:hypothetical protein
MLALNNNRGMTYQTNDKHLTNLREYFVGVVKLAVYCWHNCYLLRVFTNNLLEYLSNWTLKKLLNCYIEEFFTHPGMHHTCYAWSVLAGLLGWEWCSEIRLICSGSNCAHHSMPWTIFTPVTNSRTETGVVCWRSTQQSLMPPSSCKHHPNVYFQYQTDQYFRTPTILLAVSMDANRSDKYYLYSTLLSCWTTSKF